MARYFSSKQDTPRGKVVDEIMAVSDELDPSTKDERGNPVGPGFHAYADLTIHHTPAREEVMWSTSPQTFGTSTRQSIHGEYMTQPSGAAIVSRVTGLHEDFVHHAVSAERRSSSPVTKAVADASTAANDIMWHISKNQFYGMNTDRMPQYRQAGINYAKSISKVRRTVEPQLFHHSPSNTEVFAAFTDPSMRATVPIMGAYAHMKYEPSGKPMVASHDLSKYSSQMLQHAQDLGLPVVPHQANATAQVTNSFTLAPRLISRENIEQDLANKRMDEIPQTEIKQAKKHYRAMRKRDKAPSEDVPNETPHPRLPGMENY